VRRDLVDALTEASNAPGTGLATAALVVARIEYPRLEVEPYLTRLDRMGEAARRRIERHIDETGDRSTLSCIKGFNAYLFEEQHFVGNRERYEDPRNSCLNEVLDRRTGIPITLSLVYMEVGRRAGLQRSGAAAAAG
jgi:regulator of sirC expression with transglutaminase-like and TPR domain